MRAENLLLLLSLALSLFLASKISGVSYLPGVIKAGKSHGNWQEGVLEFKAFSMSRANCTVFIESDSGNKSVPIELERGENLVRINITLRNGTNRVSYHVECD